MEPYPSAQVVDTQRKVKANESFLGISVNFYRDWLTPHTLHFFVIVGESQMHDYT